MKINNIRSNDAKSVLVTIAIPIYNTVDTLMQSVQSIVNQDYGNLEILLINDGSTDNSGMLCKSLSNEFSFINTIDINHSGVSEARNRAIDIAKGEYIAFIDSDDFVEINYVSSLIKLALENPNSLPVCGIELRDREHNTLIEKREYAEENKLKSPSEFISLYTSGLFSSPCNKLYRPQLLKSKGIRFNTNISTGEDLLFNLRYLRECRGFVVDNTPLYVYNVAESGTLHTKHDASRFTEIQTMAKALIGALKTFRCNTNAKEIVALKLLDEYMHAFRLFCLNNENTPENRKLLSDVMKTEEFKFAFKSIKNSQESMAYKSVLRLKNAHLIMKYFSRNTNSTENIDNNFVNDIDDINSDNEVEVDSDSDAETKEE